MRFQLNSNFSHTFLNGQLTCLTIRMICVHQLQKNPSKICNSLTPGFFRAIEFVWQKNLHSYEDKKSHNYNDYSLKSSVMTASFSSLPPPPPPPPPPSYSFFWTTWTMMMTTLEQYLSVSDRWLSSTHWCLLLKTKK